MKNGYQIDFLSFTLPSGHVPRAVKLLDKFDLKSQDKGLYGYAFSYAAPGVRLLFTPDRADVHIQLSGRGCDLFDCLSLPSDARVTRLDLAFDSYDGFYTCEDVWGCLQCGATAGTARTISGYVGFAGEFAGRTIYVGSPKSDIRLRVYDKAAEQRIPLDKRIDFKDWTRYELQIRNGMAEATYRQILHEISLLPSCHNAVYSSVFASILRPLFFVCPDSVHVDLSRKNKKTLVPCYNWLSMFSQFASVRPQVVRKAPTLRNLTRYVMGAAASFKALRVIVDDFDDYFYECVYQSSFSEKHEELLIDYAPFHADNAEAEQHYYNLPF